MHVPPADHAAGTARFGRTRCRRTRCRQDTLSADTLSQDTLSAERCRQDTGAACTCIPEYGRSSLVTRWRDAWAVVVHPGETGAVCACWSVSLGYSTEGIRNVALAGRPAVQDALAGSAAAAGGRDP